MERKLNKDLVLAIWNQLSLNDLDAAIQPDLIISHLHKINFPETREQSLSYYEIFNLIGVSSKINFEQFCHFFYIIIYANLQDLKSILFFISDSNFEGLIDQEDIFYILTYIGFNCSQEEVFNLLGNQELFSNKDFNIIMQAFSNEYQLQTENYNKNQLQQEHKQNQQDLLEISSFIDKFKRK